MASEVDGLALLLHELVAVCRDQLGDDAALLQLLRRPSAESLVHLHTVVDPGAGPGLQRNHGALRVGSMRRARGCVR